MDYRQLRAEYDAAFERLRRADRELRSIRQARSTVKAEEEPARQRFEQAMNDYRACRKRLADRLLSGRPAGSRTLGVWTIETARPDGARQDEVQDLAHRLWEEAGRPLGKAEEHWYQAEKMLPNR